MFNSNEMFGVVFFVDEVPGKEVDNDCIYHKNKVFISCGWISIVWTYTSGVLMRESCFMTIAFCYAKKRKRNNYARLDFKWPIGPQILDLSFSYLFFRFEKVTSFSFCMGLVRIENAIFLF